MAVHHRRRYARGGDDQIPDGSRTVPYLDPHDAQSRHYRGGGPSRGCLSEVDGRGRHQRLSPKLQPNTEKIREAHRVSLADAGFEIFLIRDNLVWRYDAIRANLSLLLPKSRFSVWDSSVQHRQDYTYQHIGDLAADGLHGVDLLVSAGRIGPRDCGNLGGRDIVLCVLRSGCSGRGSVHL